MGLEMGKRNASSEQEKRHEESTKRFELRVSNDFIKGKQVPKEDQQMAKIQTHAIFEKHFREEIKQRGIQMREDDLQKIMSISGQGSRPTLSTISNNVERLSDGRNVSQTFRLKPIFDKIEPRTIYGAEAEELAKRYPMDELQKAAETAMEKTTEQIKRSESSAIDEL